MSPHCPGLFKPSQSIRPSDSTSLCPGVAPRCPHCTSHRTLLHLRCPAEELNVKETSHSPSCAMPRRGAKNSSNVALPMIYYCATLSGRPLAENVSTPIFEHGALSILRCFSCQSSASRPFVRALLGHGGRIKQGLLHSTFEHRALPGLRRSTASPVLRVPSHLMWTATL